MSGNQTSDVDKLKQNVRRYPFYIALTNVLPWMPVFFFYFNQLLSLPEIIQLASIYYLAVVFFEVPSGYISDRFGRRLILICSAALMTIAYVFFIIADQFAILVIADVLLAAGIAFQSGSDTSLLYDSLQLLNKEEEYTRHEAKAQQYGLVTLAFSCLIGGWLGSYELVYAYMVSVGAGVGTLLMATGFFEPSTSGTRASDGFSKQLILTARYLKDSYLLWLFGYFVLSYVLAHLVYEFYQPYISLLDDNNPLLSGSGNSPMVSGVVIALSMLVAALGVRSSLRLLRGFGLQKLLLGCALLQTIAMVVAASVLHPIVLLVFIARNLPTAVAKAPRLGAIAPRIHSRHRATYLSIESLCGRLAVSSMLYLLTKFVAVNSTLDWPSLSGLLLACATTGIVGTILLMITRRFTLGK